MFGLFKRPAILTGSPAPTIDAIYGMIVTQARLPVFYQSYGVPDTVNGRFDMIVLHLWMVLRRFRVSEKEIVPQALMDRFCSDMDGNLREMGVSDLTVPKRMLGFAEAFYGRSAAYDAALQAGTAQLMKALARNVLVTEDGSSATALADYVRSTIASLDRLPDNDLRTASWGFPVPEPRLVNVETVS